MTQAQNAALNIALDSISRRMDRAWTDAERQYVANEILVMKAFPLSQAGYVAHALATKTIKLNLF